MDGESKSQQTQNSTTNPWQDSMPALQGMLGQISTGLGNTALTGAENGALNTLQANAAQGNPFAGQIGNNANELLAGGGAMNQAGTVNDAYKNYYDQTNPMASNTNYNPYDTPGFKDALGTTIADITNSTNGQFAAAGRDFSGMSQQTLGRGILQGVAPTIAAQYNQNVQNQQGAAGNLLNAGNTKAGLLSGMQQQGIANKQAGTQAASTALDAQNYGANATLAAEAARRGIPVQALGMLAQIGIPIAGLGSQSTGQSSGTQQMSGADQFGKIATGAGGLFKAAFPYGI